MNSNYFYYDTVAFTYYLLTNDFKAEYNPENKNIHPCISLSVIEEYLHIMAGQEAYKEYETGEYEDFLSAWEKLDKNKVMFDILDPNNRKVQQLFFRITGALIKKLGSAFEDRYGEDVIGGIDAIHIATADVCECDAFLTFDAEFEVFNRLDFRDFDSLKEIVIFDDDTGEIESKISLSSQLF